MKYSRAQFVIVSRFTALFLLAGLVAGFATVSVASDIQRMRIPVGTYWIGDGGGGEPPVGTVSLGGADDGGGPPGSYSLPAFCIDRGRHAPKANTGLGAISGDIVVARYRGDNKIDERSMQQAVSGPDAWLRVNGIGADYDLVGSPTAIAVTPLDKSYSYKIVVAGLTLAGVDHQDVDDGFTAFAGNQDLRKISAAFDRFRQVLLESGLGGEEPAYALETARQSYEWKLFGNKESGAVIPSQPIDFAAARLALSLSTAQSLGISNGEATIEQISGWIRLATSKLYPKKQLEALSGSLQDLGFTGSADDVDPAQSQSILTALSSLEGNSYSASWPAFGRYRMEEKSSFDDSLRVLAMSYFTEEELTSGRIDVQSMAEFSCESLYGVYGDLAVENDILHLVVSRKELAKAVGFYKEPAGRTVKISATKENICFQWLEAGTVKTKILDLATLKEGDLAAIGATVWLSDNPSLKARLSSLNVNVETPAAASSRLATSAQTTATADGDFRVRSSQRDDERALDVSMLNLTTKGDSTFAKLPNGDLMIIDTGLGSNIVEKLRLFIHANYKVDQPSIRLVVTHTDQDHIGGLLAILDAGFPLQEVIIGTSRKDVTKHTRVDAIKAAFEAKNYQVDTTDSMIHIKQKKPAVTSLIDIENPTLPTLAGDVLEGWELYLGDQTSISFVHSKVASEPNDAGILVKFAIRGKSVLLTDDLSASTLSAMTEGLGDFLKAGFLKWPHHLWFPTESSPDRGALLRFLNSVSPHTVTFSNVGHFSHTPDRFKTICDYLKDKIAKSVECYWTRGKQANIALQL